MNLVAAIRQMEALGFPVTINRLDKETWNIWCKRMHYEGPSKDPTKTCLDLIHSINEATDPESGEIYFEEPYYP